MNKPEELKAKILFFTSSMAGGGAERVVAEIVNNIDRDKFTPMLSLFKKEGPYIPLIEKDVSIYELSGCKTNYKSFVRTTYQIQNVIQTIQPDLIVSHLTNSNRSIIRAKIISKNFCPVIVCEHNNLTRNLWKIANPILIKLAIYEIQFLYKRAAKIVAVSQGVKKDLISHFGMIDKHVSVIYNPLCIKKIENIQTNNDRVKGNKRVKEIIAVGRLTPQKGFHDLINAFALVHQIIPSRLTILGEGALRTELENQVHGLRLDECVQLPGFVNDPWSFFYNSDLFVLSSYWEGFGNVIIEAMSCGVPVISTDCNYGPSEIINQNKDGILVPVGDIQAMSQAIIKLLTTPQLRKLFSKRAKEKVNLFDVKKIVEKYELLFYKILNL